MTTCRAFTAHAGRGRPAGPAAATMSATCWGVMGWGEDSGKRLCRNCCSCPQAPSRARPLLTQPGWAAAAALKMCRWSWRRGGGSGGDDQDCRCCLGCSGTLLDLAASSYTLGALQQRMARPRPKPAAAPPLTCQHRASNQQEDEAEAGAHGEEAAEEEVGAENLLATRCVGNQLHVPAGYLAFCHRELGRCWVMTESRQLDMLWARAGRPPGHMECLPASSLPLPASSP